MRNAVITMGLMLALTGVSQAGLIDTGILDLTGADESFDGTVGDEIVTDTTGADLGLVGTGAKTFVARIKTSSSDRLGILSYSPTDGVDAGKDLRLVLANGTDLRLEINDGAARTQDVTLDDDEWHTVAAIIPDSAEAQDITFYIDGIMYSDNIGSGTTVDTADTTDDPQKYIRIGGDQTLNNPTGSFDGTIDWVAIEDSALTSQEIAALPEPATMSLLALGGLGVLLKRKR